MATDCSLDVEIVDASIHHLAPQRAKEYLASNLSGDILIADVAKAYGLSRGHFTRSIELKNNEIRYPTGRTRWIRLIATGTSVAGLVANDLQGEADWCCLELDLRPICDRYFEALGVIMMPSHDIGVQGRALCSDRRSTSDCSTRAASRYLVGSSPRLTHSTAHRTMACGVSCHSPRRISCGVS
jgi:hypothetical protein